jgi:MFS family permease
MKHNGMRIFVIIWLGQMVSLIGTAMTRFALLIWTYQLTQQATAVALLGFFSFLPYVLFSPLAGIVVDRYDRRWVMILADMGAGFMTIGLLILYRQDGLQIWHLYLAQAAASLFESFQLPAYTAVTSTLVDKSQYGRINGMRSMASAAADVIAPLSAGLVVTLIGIGGVMVFDVVTFLVAMATLFVVRLPRSNKPTANEESESFWREMSAGLRFIAARRGLLGLLITFVGINLFALADLFCHFAPDDFSSLRRQRTGFGQRAGDAGRRSVGWRSVDECVGRAAAQNSWRVGVYGRFLSLRRPVVWGRAQFTGLAAGCGRFIFLHPAVGWLKPRHLAS